MSYNRLMLGGSHIQFYRSLANSAKAGVNLSEALEILGSGSPGIRTVILRDILRRVQRGESLSGALEAHPDQFPTWQAAMIRVGEKTGRLDSVFLGIAEMIEERRSFVLDLLSKLAYPLFLLNLAPFMLNAGVAISQGTGAYLASALWLLLEFDSPILILAFLIRQGLLTWRLFPMGSKLYKAQFCSFLSMMMKAGVAQPAALEMSAAASGIPPPARLAPSGSSMLEALKAYGLFSHEELARIQIAERSGKLDDDLHLLSVEAREKWQAALKAMSSILPAVIFLVIALTLAQRIISSYTNSWDQLNQALQGR